MHQLMKFFKLTVSHLALRNVKKPFLTCTAPPSSHTGSQELTSSSKLRKQMLSKVKIQIRNKVFINVRP